MNGFHETFKTFYLKIKEGKNHLSFYSEYPNYVK